MLMGDNANIDVYVSQRVSIAKKNPLQAVATV